MAQRTIVETYSDISGAPEAVTVSFAFENAAYSIDLTHTEREDFVRAIAAYTAAARKTAGARSARGAGTRPASRADLDAIREWARANGHTVADRGRIPGAVLAAYEAR
ncbi:Lsr2 family protein [Xylanimonas allomyrinae]|uniref:Lsr2 family protein n=1 Tax=Xylanimonas allomyrinae TaxID=2509459 RepID=A0A4P6ELP3_9MICO|nr:Lsr2 family protein [Xylanimonas allomyrinae]QAY63186.1 Lsr2 family protein [Xylanimonas allomyrinae]